MIDLNAMVVFAKVVEAGTYTAAGTILGLPKSTVSRKVSQLESRLGVRLLQRNTRKLKLTEAGAAFYSRCVRILAEAEEAERCVSQEQIRPSGLLRVSAPVELGTVVLGDLVAGYLARFPEVRLELELSNRMVDLVEEGYDLAIRAGVLPDSSLVTRRLGNDRIVACAAPAYLVQRGEPHTPDRLKHHDCILYGQGERALTFTFSGAEGEIRVQLSGKLRSNNQDLIRAAAVAGLGIALLPESLCGAAIADARLQPVLTGWRLPEHGVYAIYPSPRHLTPKVRSFIDYLSEHMAFRS